MASSATKKGNRGQRKAIKLIESWTHKKFKSSSQSGMAGWNHDPHKGDVLCDTEGHYFPFCVEVKNYKDINFCQLIQPDLKGVTILEFWKQCSGDAVFTKKIPMLLMRFNNLPADFFFVVVTQEFAKAIHFELTLSNAGLKSLRYHDYKTDLSLMIMPSNQFFNTNYKEVKKTAKTFLKA